MYYRPSFTVEEDLRILNLIIDNNAYYQLKSKAWWQDLEKSNQFPGRTWQSLKERFMKKIFPAISTYNIEEGEKTKLKLAWYQLESHFTQSEIPKGVEVCYADESD